MDRRNRSGTPRSGAVAERDRRTALPRRVVHTGRERLESNAWDDEDATAYWWLVKLNGGTVSVAERDEVLRGALVPGTTEEWS